MSRHSALVASGIFLSRVAGLLRESVFAHYFGSSDAADVFRAAFRIPNLLQNLFGEGALSASFIPVYVKLLDPESRDEADRLASAIFCLLALVVSCLVLVGVFATPYLIDVIAPGFSGAKRDLTISLVRILFPGAGLLVLSAWCLGILNSHRRFFVSYTAPVAWNLAMIATLIGLRAAAHALSPRQGPRVGLCGGQRPADRRSGPPGGPPCTLLQGRAGPCHRKRQDRGPQLRPCPHHPGGRADQRLRGHSLASFLPTGALAGIGYAQTLYTLPVSLFGMSVSAAELPAFSSATGPGEGSSRRTCGCASTRAYARSPFSSCPGHGFSRPGRRHRRGHLPNGRFTHHDATYVWAILAGSAVGLLAATLGRLYASTYYALRDTRTPLYLRSSGWPSPLSWDICALPLPRLLGIDARWGAVGLTGSAGIAAWLEFALLRHSLKARIGTTGLAATFVLKLWVAAAAGAGADGQPSSS